MLAILAVVAWIIRPAGYFRPIDMSREKVDSHLPSDCPNRLKHVIRVPGVEAENPYWDQKFEIEIDPAGHPLKVKFLPPSSEVPVPTLAIVNWAVAQLRTWTFVPFRVKNQSIYARFTAEFTLVPEQDRPSVDIPFPQVTDLNKVTMRYKEGGGMFGRSPRYVTVRGDGGVDIGGFDGYGHPRPSPITIPKEQVQSLIDAFRRANFYSLKDAYFAPITDQNDKVVSITIDGKSKTVEDYVGEFAGLPDAAAEVEEALQRAGGFEP